MDLRSSRTRIMIVAALAALWAGAVFGRLAYLQLFRYSEYYSRAQHQQRLVVDVSASRAEIFDRNMNPLAMSVPVDSAFAVPSEIADPDMVARLLGKVLDTPADEIATKLASSHSFVWIARKLPPEKANRIAAMNLRGIYFQREGGRFYPKRELAAHVLGYVDMDEKGLGGIEYALDDSIRTKAGKMLILADAHRRWYDSTDKTPDSGTSVELTLDEKIQYIAEKELAQAIQETHAKAGTVMVENPNTGELLAVANWPTFNPNAAKDSPPEARVDRAASALYEPGSVFKIVTLSAAIDQGITNPDEVIDCQNGAIYIAGQRIRDHKAYGNLTVSQILQYSSDVGAIKLGLRLGAPKFYDYIRAFGFGQTTGVDLPGESRGKLRRLENWTPVSVGSISMGQEVGVTPMQMVTAVTAIANGGLIIRPHVIREQRHGNQLMEPQEPQPRRVIKETTAASMRRMLEGVVLGGTGKKAKLDGYTSAGKTGTAQKYDPETGRYSTHDLIASFVGFAPINTPAVTIYVQLDSPVGPHDGGQVAAPVFQRVAQQVLPYLEVPRDIPVTAGTMRANRPPAVHPVDESLTDVSDFDPVQSTAGPTANEAASAIPAPAPTAAPPTVELAEGDGIPAPHLLGRTVREVTQQCLKLGLTPSLVGTGVATMQSPEAGAMIRRGSRITVQFGRGATLLPASARGKAK
ncbi:MAG TPA: penicillin-binding transpeptidase domain-containing protein [Candidatus Acidoferrales bacterium]|nr:penicillin-binding transpeptidase domain-containing protein [Candidatus Acidoferrales bacterium]